MTFLVKSEPYWTNEFEGAVTGAMRNAPQGGAVGDRNVVPQHTGERRRVGVVADNGARLEFRPLILWHLAIQIAQLLAARQRCRARRRELSSIRCRGGLGRRAHRLCQGQSRQAPGCSFVRRSSANSIVSDSPIRRRCTPTLFPAILGLHDTQCILRWSFGYSHVRWHGARASAPARASPPELLCTRFCIGTGNCPVLVQAMRNLGSDADQIAQVICTIHRVALTKALLAAFLKVSLPLIYRLARGSRGRGLSGCTPHVPRGV